ncbi:S8 family peptidase [Enterocloster citroniae]|uniref:S8 family peptidase n=1 Tax=Enterocloster citroniae TaxID=358743 RepID=UPI0034A25D3B
MAGTNDFMHLALPVKKTGQAKYPQTLVPGKQMTNQNKNNRQGHRQTIRSQAQGLSRFWQDRKNERNSKNLPTIEGGVPFLLEIEPTTDVEFLRGLGFEVVCDLDEGFIVVSSEQTNLADFLEKVDGFVNNIRGTGNVAKVYALHTDDDRLKRILSEELYNQWSKLDGATYYTVDISVGCAGTGSPPNLPSIRKDEAEEDYNNRVKDKMLQYQLAVDELIMERQTQLENIVSYYDGEFLSSFIEDGDSFSVTLKITGIGLRDVVLNYSYIFEVAFKTDVMCDVATSNTQEIPDGLTIDEPTSDSPIICVIDSGIQENHIYLEKAIVSADSKCLIPGQTSVTDEVSYGGHGTRVAGAVLYPNGIPASGIYQLPCFVRNIKILDGNNGLSDNVSREGIIDEAVRLFSVEADNKTKIFNHSIGERKPFYELKHMSAWAAKIDEVSYENDVLFIQAAGNIVTEVIKTYIQAGYQYPDYLGQQLSQISNPAQSFQALTVGSISHSDFEDDDIVAMGKKNEPSSFTRVGPGIWDSIKPDVVEYGGTHAVNKSGHGIDLTTPEEVCPDLIRRSPQGPAHAKDGIGTSFATPKVSYIASEIQKILPNSSSLLYRALIVQSARWPNISTTLQNNEAQKMLRRVGYGLPDVNRATQNNTYRATLVSMDPLEIGDKEAHIFTVNVPQELRDVGENYNILLEITLSYAAKPKRTRRSHRNYLSTWLDWTCSKKNESRQDFEARIFEADSSGQDDGQFPWMIHERQNWGTIKDFARPRQTLQKDWCIINASDLDETFCIAVRGHKGWGSLFKAKYAIAVSFEAIDENIEIYEHIRLENQVNIEVDSPEVRVEVDSQIEQR